jgi:hypothetical protein
MSRKYEPLVFAILMSVLMTLPVSFVMTLVGVGFNARFVGAWLVSLALGIGVSIPVAYFAVPAVRRIVERVMIDE